jgi:hypothetical protein
MFFLYTKVATSNVHPTHEPNELARATNEPSQAGIFARFLTSRAELARLFNEPDRAEPSRAELARGPALRIYTVNKPLFLALLLWNK